MANQKITDLTEITAPDLTSLLYFMSDPDSEQLDRVVSVEDFMKNEAKAYVFQASTTSKNIAATTTYYPVTFDTEYFDFMDSCDTTTFTAPIDGIYLATFNIRVDVIQTAANNYIASICSSNRRYNFIVDPGGFSANLSYISIGMALLVEMDASDTITFDLYQGSGGTPGSSSSVGSVFYDKISVTFIG